MSTKVTEQRRALQILNIDTFNTALGKIHEEVIFFVYGANGP